MPCFALQSAQSLSIRWPFVGDQVRKQLVVICNVCLWVMCLALSMFPASAEDLWQLQGQNMIANFCVPV